MDRKNLRLASKLLDEAGWLVGDDGLRRNSEGEVFTLEIIERSPAFDRVVLPCLLYTSPSPRDLSTSRMPSSA